MALPEKVPEPELNENGWVCEPSPPVASVVNGVETAGEGAIKTGLAAGPDLI
jgi:hypothetical protein